MPKSATCQPCTLTSAPIGVENSLERVVLPVLLINTLCVARSSLPVQSTHTITPTCLEFTAVSFAHVCKQWSIRTAIRAYGYSVARLVETLYLDVALALCSVCAGAGESVTQEYMAETFQLLLAGINDAKSQCGSATVTLSLQDMRTHRISANQLVQVR